MPDPCQNGGQCIFTSGNQRCNCVDGYTGDNCEIAPVTGCTDERATNYNSAATVDDEQCTYRVYIDVDMRCSDVDFLAGNFVLIKGLDHSYDDLAVNAGRYDLAYSSDSQLWELNNETPNNEIILEEGTEYYFNVNVAGMIYEDVNGDPLDEPVWTEWKNYEEFQVDDTLSLIHI